ncbi:MAG: class I SAM-dependent methyltransferase [Chloroflexota bacterium]
MVQERRLQETIRAIQNDWPTFVGIYGCMVICLIIIGVSLQRMWFAFVPMSLALIILLGIFFAGRIWAVYQLYDDKGLRPHDVLFDLGSVQEIETLVYIDHGNRRRGLNLARRLTTGKIIMVDIYNPQWMPSQILVRQRVGMPMAVPDPRITWKDSQFNLLPLPDQSVSIVMLCQVLSELWQQGDQEILLKEIYRIMKPNGRLLIAERLQNKTNLTLLEGFSFQSEQYWQRLLIESGYQIQRDTNLQNLIHCFRAIKPTPYEAQQMALELNFES